MKAQNSIWFDKFEDLWAIQVPESFEDELDDEDGGAADGHALVELDDVVEAEEDLQFERWTEKLNTKIKIKMIHLLDDSP